jgi:hypothetical protein
MRVNDRHEVLDGAPGRFLQTLDDAGREASASNSGSASAGPARRAASTPARGR